MLLQLPQPCIDAVCAALSLEELAVLRRTCSALRRAGARLRWNWRLSHNQSHALYTSHVRDAILGPCTIVHTFDATCIKDFDFLLCKNARKIIVTPQQVRTTPFLYENVQFDVSWIRECTRLVHSGTYLGKKLIQNEEVYSVCAGVQCFECVN